LVFNAPSGSSSESQTKIIIIVVIWGAKGSGVINFLLLVVELNHSERNKNGTIIIYHQSGVEDMQRSHLLTFALVGAHQRTIT